MSLKGHFVVFALVKETTYGTPVLAAAGHGMIVGPGGEGIEYKAALIPDDTIEGRVVELEGERGGVTVDGPWNDMPIVFDSIHRPLAFAMGTAGVPLSVITIKAGVNDKIDFTEGVTGAAVATLTAGVYSLAELATEAQTQINAAATDNTYTVDFGSTVANRFSFVRATGTATIAMAWVTGPNNATSAGATLGFTADDTGGTTYSGDADVAPGAYRHVLKIATAIEALHATLVHGFSGQSVREYISAKTNGFTLNMPNGAKWNCQIPFICFDANFDDSGPNKLATLSGITRPGTRRLALFRQTAIRRNNQSAGALSTIVATDVIRTVSSFNIQLVNNLPTDDFTLLNGDRRDNNDRDGKVKVTGSIEYSKTPDDADMILGKNRTAQKMDCKVAGPVIDAAATNPGDALTQFAMNLFMPSVQFSVSSPIGGAGRVPKTLNYEAQGVETVPTGFPAGYTDPVTIEIVNTDSANPLA